MPSPLHIHVGFFGITRSLRHTIGSIQTNILAPLRSHADTLRLYGHFHLPATIDNPRSGERQEAVDPQEAALLALDVCEIDPQDETLIAENLAAAKCCNDVLQDGYASARNLCFQLRSLDRLWSLMEPSLADTNSPTTQIVVLLRPDLRYLDPLPIASLLAAITGGTADLAIPAWHGWGGLNDRFTVANARAAKHYATRIQSLAPAMRDYGGLHGESLLAYAVRQAGLRVMDLPVRAVRIRANGLAEARDLREFGMKEAVLF
jgi:hypothetical protein